MGLPTGYVQLEYLQSNGGQYINSNYVQTSEKQRIVCDVTFTETHNEQSICGSQNQTDWHGTIIPHCTNGTNIAIFCGLNFPVTVDGTLNTDYQMDILADNGTLTATINGTTYTGNYDPPIISGFPIYVFANNHAGNAVQIINGLRLRKLQLYDGELLVRDFVPALRVSDNVGGLYDLANGSFYTNIGSGTFSCGPVADTLPTDTLLLIHGEDISDSSVYNRAINNYGVTVSSDQSRFGGSSLYFDGSGARLSVENLLLGNTPFTIECWAFPVQYKANTIWSHGGTNTAAVTGGGMELYTNGQAIYYCNGFLINGGSYSLNQWHHIALVGEQTKITLYVNGVAVGVYNGTYDFANYIEDIGANASIYGGENFHGYLDEIRISSVARWTSDFIPPDAPYSITIVGGLVEGLGAAVVKSVSYGLTKGKTMVGGTAYDVTKGRTLVNGTAYEIAYGAECVMTIGATSSENNPIYAHIIVDGVQYNSTFSLSGESQQVTLKAGTTIDCAVRYISSYSNQVHVSVNGANQTLSELDENGYKHFYYTVHTDFSITTYGYMPPGNTIVAEIDITET